MAAQSSAAASNAQYTKEKKAESTKLIILANSNPFTISAMPIIESFRSTNRHVLKSESNVAYNWKQKLP